LLLLYITTVAEINIATTKKSQEQSTSIILFIVQQYKNMIDIKKYDKTVTIDADIDNTNNE
jgi:hypothetical protein